MLDLLERLEEARERLASANRAKIGASALSRPVMQRRADDAAAEVRRLEILVANADPAPNPERGAE